MAAIIMLAPLVAGLMAFTIYPTLYLLFLSATKSTLGQPFKSWIGGANYVWIGGGDGGVFLTALLRSAVFAFSAASIELVAGTALALLLLAPRGGGSLIRGSILLPLMTPPILVGTAWKLLLAPGGGFVNGKLQAWGFVDAPVSFLGGQPWADLSIIAADVWQWTPFITVMAYASLRQVPVDMLEAARLDGATEARIFWTIVLPLTAPALAAIFILRLIMAFKTFDLVYILTYGGPGNSTALPSFAIWRLSMRSFDVGLAAAETVLFAVFVSLALLPVIALHKRFEEKL
jgi:multiple sugar transport system permease protein